MHSPVISFGDSIGRYRFIAEVATGGMGVIYLAARHGPAGFSQLVAVKELKPEFVQDPSYVGMFLEEGRIAARFAHPNIVQTLETDQHDGRFFIVMEYLEGKSFGRIEQKFVPRGGFPTWMSLSILCDVLSALDYVHELADEHGKPLGFVHRDVSPQNIFVTFDGHTKVIDFGIAKGRETAQQTQNGVLKGKLSYMAPEQLAHDASRRSDIFSVGAILFEVIAGRLLWHGKSDIEIFGHLSRSEVPSADLDQTDAAPALRQICKKALSPRAEDRFATAAEMREALADYLWKTGTNNEGHAAQAISAAVQDAFGIERERTRSVIRSYFAQLEKGYRGPLAKLALAERTATNIPAQKSVGPIVVAPPTGNDFVDFDRKTVETPMPPMLMPPSGSLLMRLWATNRRAVVVTAAVAITLGLLIGFWPRHAVMPIAAPEPQPAPIRVVGSVPEVPRAHEAETIALSVTVAPPQAQIAIDGEVMPSNPFLGRFPKSGATHRVRVTAPGYLPKERVVSFADNVMLDLNLNARPEPREPAPRRREPPPQRKPASPPPPPAAPAPVATATRSAPPSDIPAKPADGSRRRRIETANPYQEDQ